MSTPARQEIIRALLFAEDEPLSVKQLERLLAEDGPVTAFEVLEAIRALQAQMEGSSLELVEVASGYRVQIRREFAGWIGRLWQDKPQKYSRALLETLALICYRQPLTRGDIEEIRGVSLSAGILRTLFDREWVREVGHREGPGRPALLATTRQFLDDFNLRSLDELPTLPELSDPEQLEAAMARLAPVSGVLEEAAEVTGDEGEEAAPVPGAPADDAASGESRS